MKSFFMIFLSLMLCALTSLAVASSSPELTPAQNDRYQDLTAEFRCVVCQDENIANSAAPMAADMRALVAKQVRAGRSNRQIKAYMVERYGDFILYDPPFNTKTVVLWLGPFALLLVGLVMVFMLVRRRGGLIAAPLHKPVDRGRLDDLLSEGTDGPDHSSRLNR